MYYWSGGICACRISVLTKRKLPGWPVDLLTEAPSDPSEGELTVAGVLMFGARIAILVVFQIGCGVIAPGNWLLLVAPLPMDTPLFPWTFRPLVLFGVGRYI